MFKATEMNLQESQILRNIASRLWIHVRSQTFLAAVSTFETSGKLDLLAL